MRKGLAVVLALVVFAMVLTNQIQSQGATTVYSLDSSPTISAKSIDTLLKAHGSPAVGLGSVMYQDGLTFGIDPVYALAFFLHEDGMGTTGWGAVNRSLGNTRCSTGYQCRGGYRAYATWGAGFLDWFHLLRTLYIDTWGLHTVEQIIPVYAPSSDHNDVQGYIASIKSSVDMWRLHE